jgi:hypothetical protein
MTFVPETPGRSAIAVTDPSTTCQRISFAERSICVYGPRVSTAILSSESASGTLTFGAQVPAARSAHAPS